MSNFAKRNMYTFIIKQTLTQFVYTINMFFEKNLTFDKKYMKDQCPSQKNPSGFPEGRKR